MSCLNFGEVQASRPREGVLDSEVARELAGSSVSILLDQEKC